MAIGVFGSLVVFLILLAILVVIAIVTVRLISRGKK
jgi:hypothetical protein